MHTNSVAEWLHDHTFGQDMKRPGERRTWGVVVITAATMVVEIVAGFAFGSMALLADGLHMASHASALTISAFAYYYTRRHASDTRFNFGTGKINSLAAFASATMLALFALVMVWESVERFISPLPIEFNSAIIVAIAGFAVNGVSLLILGGGEAGGHHHHHEHGEHHDHSHHHDHNLWSARLHVLADAVTSVLAIFALIAAKYVGLHWLDPLMGVVGAMLVIRWSWGLLRASSAVLVDVQAPLDVRQAIQESIESHGDNRVYDLHVWSVGPGIYAAEIGVVASQPFTTEEYAEFLPKHLGLVHVMVETRTCSSAANP